MTKDLFHLFKKDENTDKLNKDNLAEEAFKEMDANTGKINNEYAFSFKKAFIPY